MYDYERDLKYRDKKKEKIGEGRVNESWRTTPFMSLFFSHHFQSSRPMSGQCYMMSSTSQSSVPCWDYEQGTGQVCAERTCAQPSSPAILSSGIRNGSDSELVITKTTYSFLCRWRGNPFRPQRYLRTYHMFKTIQMTALCTHTQL